MAPSALSTPRRPPRREPALVPSALQRTLHPKLNDPPSLQLYPSSSIFPQRSDGPAFDSLLCCPLPWFLCPPCTAPIHTPPLHIAPLGRPLEALPPTPVTAPGTCMSAEEVAAQGRSAVEGSEMLSVGQGQECWGASVHAVCRPGGLEAGIALEALAAKPQQHMHGRWHRRGGQTRGAALWCRQPGRRAEGGRRACGAAATGAAGG